MTDEKPIDHDDLVTAWIGMATAAYASDDPDIELDERMHSASSTLDDFVDEQPERAWPLILAIIARDQSTPVVELLAAGPLEDILAKHGPSFIERVEIEARRNPRFAKLLGGVWRNSMTDDIWRRVQAVWDRRGWDGVPE